MHGRFHSELANGVEDEIHAQAALGEGLGGRQHGFEVGFGDLLAEDHDADRERDLGVDDALRQEMFAEVAGDEGVVPRFAQERGHPFEDFQELVEVFVGVLLANFRFGEHYPVGAGESADGLGLDGPFQMQVQFGFGKGGDGLRGMVCGHVKV